MPFQYSSIDHIYQHLQSDTRILLFFLNLSNFLAASFLIWADLAFENTFMCSFQATFVEWFSLAQVLWMMIFVIHLYMKFVVEETQILNSPRWGSLLYVLYNIIGWVIPLILAIFGVAFRMYGPAQLWYVQECSFLLVLIPCDNI